MTMPWEERYQTTTAPGGMPWEERYQFVEPERVEVLTAPAPAPTLDLTRSGRDIYADIQKLPGNQRQKVLDQWADLRVAKAREGGGAGQRMEDVGVNVARGQLFGSYLDEFGGWVGGKLHDISGGAIGAPQDAMTALARARDRAISKERPIESGVTQLAGGLAAGIPLFNALAAPKTVAQGVKQGVALGVPLGAAAGHGEGTGDIDDPSRLAKMKTGGAVGGGLGVVLPPAIAGGGKVLGIISDAITPQLARMGATVESTVEALRRRLGIYASAYGPPAQPLNPGAEAAAEQIIANQLSRAGTTPDQLRRVLSEAEGASLFHGGGARGTPGASYAQNALAPVDLDPSLQRLAGSVVRQSPEAGNSAGSFLYGRQTGLTPRSGLLPEATGIPTHPKMSVRGPDDKPMGQFERVKDALKRAMLIRDEDFHGHARSAYRTEEAILNNARTESKALYGDAYKAGETVNLRSVIEPVMQKWKALADDEPGPVGDAISKAIDIFNSRSGPVANIQRFDKAKQYADGKIQKLFESVEGRDRYTGGVLNQFKNDMLAAVDGVTTNDLGTKYAAARSAFSSNMEMRDALRLGRDVFREGSEVATDQFRGLATDGQQKLFRLGLLDSFENHMGRQKRTADVTQVFDSPRIQEILGAVIPRTATATGRVKTVGGDPAAFANRPERFGRYLDTEKSFISTRNETFGGSPTQKRIVDDEAYGTLSTIVDRIRAAPNLRSLALDLTGDALNKVFGYRADTAGALARKLFTANPEERQRVLEQVTARFGRDRMQAFISLIEQQQAALTATGARAVGGVP